MGCIRNGQWPKDVEGEREREGGGERERGNKEMELATSCLKCVVEYIAKRILGRPIQIMKN